MIEESDTYVQQINRKYIDEMEYDAGLFYSNDSPFTEIYILTRLKQFSQSSVSRKDSIFHSSHKSKLKEYIVASEKILYYTLDKTNFS